MNRKPLSESTRKAGEAAKKSEGARPYYHAHLASFIAEKLWIAERGSLPANIYPLCSDGGLDEQTRKFCWWVGRNIPAEVINQAVQATQDAVLGWKAGERFEVKVWPYFRSTLRGMCKERGIPFGNEVPVEKNTAPDFPF